VDERAEPDRGGAGERESALSRARPGVLGLYAIAAAFTTYFCMYAFRKPFAAAEYGGLKLWGTGLDAKTAYVIAQILGYTISKFVGMKVCAEIGRRGRARLLVGLILAAWGALLLFALLPLPLKVLAIFLNGLPLGMVWGTVVLHLEGRRTSEFMLAGLSCSYIIASGMVKDVGRWLMSAHGVGDYWMPVTMGALFFPAFVVGVVLLAQIPPPSEADRKERSERVQMYAGDRWSFLREFLLGMALLSGMYFFLTAYRDYRDNYGVEILRELGLGERAGIFTQTEVPIAFGVMVALSLLSLVRDNRLGLILAFAIMIAGSLTMGVATWLFEQGSIGGMAWMTLVGLGAYLAYVPFGSVLFDRLLAYTRFAGTAVFAIYLTDAVGYTGSVGLQVYKDFFQASTTRLEFFGALSYFMSACGALALVVSLVYFLRRGGEEG
jgi:MFS family permease